MTEDWASVDLPDWERELLEKQAVRDAARAPIIIAGCSSRMYQPGVTHEHQCLASSVHPGLDHTCECGAVWPDFSLRVSGEGEAA